MRRAVFVSGHYLLSKRRAGLQFIADALWRQGWHVTFVTAAFSQLSRLKRDHRFQYDLVRRSHRPEEVGERLVSYVWFTPFHPLNRLPRVAGAVLDPLFRRYGRLPLGPVEELVGQADLIVFESTAGIMLFDRFKSLNPDARYVYRVSDDLDLLRAHRSVVDTERRIAPGFDLVSVPSEFVLRRFQGLTNAALHHHGIDKPAFDRPAPNPYSSDGVKAVFVGSAYLDTGFLEVASHAIPDWEFHVIGGLGRIPRRANIVAHGELPFEQTVGYVVHADVGLHTLTYRPGAESFSDSLKVLQYTYCRLPVVMPEFMGSNRPNAFAYRPGDADSIIGALRAAAAFDRSTVPVDDIWSWDELAGRIAGEAET